MEDDFQLGSLHYGEACVKEPEFRSSGINQYVTYLIEAKLGDESFSSRKRYSDFEWLRAALMSCFPGVRIPPLPKKQGALGTAQGLLSKTAIMNVKDEAFIESRRAGLEEFLKACMRMKQLCVDSKLIKGFLGTPEDSLEEFKKKIDNISIGAKCKKYAEIYAEFKDASLPDDDRVGLCKTFLKDQMQQLRELADGFKEVVNAQEAIAKAVSCAQSKLTAVAHTESGTFSRSGVPTDSRAELIAGLRKHSEVMQSSPTLHYELLLEAAEHEILAVEAMQEALDSVDNLERDMQNAMDKTTHLGATLKNAMEGGEIPSTGTGVARMLGISKPKDREERIAEMKAEHDKKLQDVAAMGELHVLARTVLLCREIQSFYSEKISAHRKTKDDFARCSQSTAERVASIWGGISRTTASNGYPVAVAEPQEPEVEYE